MRQLFDVYISYRIEYGKTYAKDLYRYLTSHGIRVFMRDSEIYYNYYPNEIQRLVKCTPHFVLIATRNVFPDHNESDNEKIDCVLEEIIAACKSFNEDGKNRTIHVLNEDALHYRPEHTLPKYISAIAVPTWQTMSEQGNNRSLFNRVLNDILEITRINVWYSAHRWYENHRRNNGWFKNNASQNLLLPNAEIKTVYEIAGEPNKPIDLKNRAIKIEPRQLFELLNHSKKNIFLIGERKIGKTTALMRIMEEYYGDGTKEIIRIPIFVELSCAPDSYGELYENGVSSYIRRAVFRQINDNRKAQHGIGVQSQEIDEAFSLPAAVSVDPVDNLFSNQAKSPHFLLLLDGLNEVSLSVLNETGLSIYWMIVKEIEYLLYNCPNVQLVVTTRSECEFSLNEKLTRFYLTGVNQETVKSFLTDAGMPKDSIENALNDKELSEVLRVPLFLTIYSTLKHYNKVTTRGEILRQFFHEQGDCIEDYTVKARVNKIEKDIVRSSGIKQKNRITATMQTFILDFILPKIAWYMEKESKYHITENMASVFIEHVLTDFSDGAICGIYGKQLFSQNKGMFAHENVRETANSFQKLGENVESVTVSIMDCCAFSLGILKKASKASFLSISIFVISFAQ